MADEESNKDNTTTKVERNQNIKTDQTTKLSKPNLLQWLEITVSEPEKRTNASMKMQDTYIVYLIETRVVDENMKGYGEGATSLWRRYSEFELLRNYLDIMYPAIVVPPLPEKKASFTWQNASTDKFDPDFIERRRQALEVYLLRVAAHPILCHDKIFMGFMQKENGWKESVYGTDFQSKADSRLKALSASFRLKKPDRRFEELKNYSNELQNNITNILRIRAGKVRLDPFPMRSLPYKHREPMRISDKLYGIHKIHANYARVYNEWSGIEKEISEALQSSGHYMDVFASSVDATLEEEEQYADQLKEYLAFGDAVRSVCRKYECVQYDLEKAEDNLSYKASQKEMLSQGKAAGTFSLSGMKTKFFGSDTPEQRDVKIKQLEEQIVQAEVELRQTQDETQKFVEAALRDMDRFKRQKSKDLKEIFTNYAIMQIKQCKKGIAIWTSAKDCFSKM